MKIYHEFKNVVERLQLVSKGDAVVIGVSGGSDSVALLHLLSEIAEDFDLKLIVAHVNYGTRGRDSDADEALVRKYAHDLGLVCEVKRVKAPKKGNFENWARETRYKFFEALRKKHKATSIAVAHTKDDQAETIIMHFAKGAGLEGLAGMKEKEGNIVRPVLSFTKDELRAYLKTRNIVWREDASNNDQKYTRNSIRHRILKDLADINPNIIETLSRNAATFREAQGFFVLEAAAFLKQHVKASRNKVEVSRKELLLQPRPVQREIIHGTLRLLGHVEPLSANHYAQIESVITKNISGKSKEISKDLKITNSRGLILFVKAR